MQGVITMSRQLEYMGHYKLHLSSVLGRRKAEEHVSKATFILSLGTNDFLQNYFLEPTRPKQFTLPDYQNFLLSSMHAYLLEMRRLGAKRLVIVGVPNLGCMPISRTFAGSDTECVAPLNNAATSLNSKLQTTLETLKANLDLKVVFIDCYKTIESAINNPKKYGMNVN